MIFYHDIRLSLWNVTFKNNDPVILVVKYSIANYCPGVAGLNSGRENQQLQIYYETLCMGTNLP